MPTYIHAEDAPGVHGLQEVFRVGAGRIHPDMLGDHEHHVDKAAGKKGLVGKNWVGWGFKNHKHSLDKTKSLRYKGDRIFLTKN